MTSHLTTVAWNTALLRDNAEILLTSPEKLEALASKATTTTNVPYGNLLITLHSMKFLRSIDKKKKLPEQYGCYAKVPMDLKENKIKATKEEIKNLEQNQY
ncbi:hypothetical protein CEXT_559511 [Caerostris extrusa]|uniref:Uncharacterized protein n=1 Tax=Caerostris extrusa TaxID=172846 RepID=A0AAV4V3Y9_CAEEX|nr:hypothetical protein CEXT_559511 [Caerostris extrusa]